MDCRQPKKVLLLTARVMLFWAFRDNQRDGQRPFLYLVHREKLSLGRCAGRVI
jgi:hypothetical protein